MSLGDRDHDRNEETRPPIAILVGEDDTPNVPGAPTLLNVSKSTFRRWVSKGLIRPVELPGGERRRLYRLADLEAFAASLAESGAGRAQGS